MEKNVREKAKLGLGLEQYSKSEVFPEDENPRMKIKEIAKLIFDRHLSDAGGGNLSCRVGGRIFITPRYLGELHRFNVNVDDIIILTLEAEVIDGNPDMVTREGDVHIRLYNEFPQVKAILHAHPRNIIPFASTGIHIPPNTEMFKHLLGNDDIEICEDVGPATDLLAKTLIDRFKRREHTLNKYGAAVMIPNHGLVVAAKNLSYAYCILETVETSAYVYMSKTLLENNVKIS